MKVVFAGPSLNGAPVPAGIVLRGPAAQGDLEAATDEGANVVGLIDGLFQQAGSVWHKEILYALSKGVRVLGAASMGALRAAECEMFGMVPVGRIAQGYASGALVDDADVALLHDAADGHYRPLTEPIVNVAATAERLLNLHLIEADDARQMLGYAHCIHFSERTVTALFAWPSPVATLQRLYVDHRVDAKGVDAAALLDAVADLPDERAPCPRGWSFLTSRFWEQRAQTHA